MKEYKVRFIIPQGIGPGDEIEFTILGAKGSETIIKMYPKEIKTKKMTPIRLGEGWGTDEGY